MISDLQVKIDNDLFGDLRTMIDRQMGYILDQITEEGFDGGEVIIKINFEGYEIQKIEDQRIIQPTIKYKVKSSLKRSLSEDNTFYSNDRILLKDKSGTYYLENYSGDQISVLEE